MADAERDRLGTMGHRLFSLSPPLVVYPRAVAAMLRQEKTATTAEEMNIEEMVKLVKPCVACGYCCRVAPCGAGKPDDQGACASLVSIGNHQFVCGLAEQIRKTPGSHLSPAFGAGCSSSLCNTDRERVVGLLTNSTNGDRIEGMISADPKNLKGVLMALGNHLVFDKHFTPGGCNVEDDGPTTQPIVDFCEFLNNTPEARAMLQERWGFEWPVGDPEEDWE